MSNYHRSYQQGGCYFFTVVTYKRKPVFQNPNNIDHLRNTFRQVKTKHPFRIDAIVVLPDHLHTIWRLPEADCNYSLRWRLIKHSVSRKLESNLNHRAEKLIWQRRFWEHTIASEQDWKSHMDYIHYNPVKHGYVCRPGDWTYSSFRQALARGWYSENWGVVEPEQIADMELE